jgi:hypothetical protein
VGDGQDLNAFVGFAEDNEERESVEQITSRTTQVGRPLPGCPVDLFDCRVELSHEGFGDLGVPSSIPLSGGPGFLDRFRM